jgi:hypothetical protein
MNYLLNNRSIILLLLSIGLTACATEPICNNGMIPLGGQVIRDNKGEIKFQLKTIDGKTANQLFSFNGNLGLETYSTLCLNRFHFENIVRRPDLYIVRTFPDGTAYLDLKP